MLSVSWAVGCGFNRIRTSWAFGPDLSAWCAAADEGSELPDVARRQHVRLREHQPVDGIVRRLGPVDQFLDYIGVGPERKNGGYRPDREPVGGSAARLVG
jgi:hypothetical protein